MGRGLHRCAVDTQRHSQRFRARDVGWRNVVDMAERPTKVIDALVLIHPLQSIEQIANSRVVDYMFVNVPASTSCDGSKLGIFVHDLGRPRILARREVEERSVECLGQTEDTELAIELVRAAT